MTFEGKLYPTQETRFKPFFGEISILPPLKDDQLLRDRPTPSADTSVARRASILDIMNPVFVTSHHPVMHTLDFDITGLSISISVSQLDTLDIDSDSVFLKVTKVIKDHKSLSDEDLKASAVEKREEMDFMLNQAVNPIPTEHVRKIVEIQPLKWVLANKTITVDESKDRHRSCIVSASHRSALRQSVHGNAPSVTLSTLRILSSILPKWIQLASKHSPNACILILCRDVLKSSIQGLKSKRRIVYRPPQEFCAAYP